SCKSDTPAPLDDTTMLLAWPLRSTLPNQRAGPSEGPTPGNSNQADQIDTETVDTNRSRWFANPRSRPNSRRRPHCNDAHSMNFVSVQILGAKYLPYARCGLTMPLTRAATKM